MTPVVACGILVMHIATGLSKPLIGEGPPVTQIAAAFKAIGWLHSVVAGLHLTGMAFLVGSVMVLNLRMLGAARGISLRNLNALVTGTAFIALFVIIPTGLVLFAARPFELIGQGAFLTKMMLLFAALVNALIFYAGPYQSAVADPDAAPTWSLRLFAAVSMCIWLAVIFIGRWLART